MEEFVCKTKIISGAGALSALGGMGCKRLFVVADPYFQKNGTAQRLAEISKAEAVTYFDKIQPDPTVELAAEGTALVREFNPDLLVAIGGGSTLDCAKAMAWFAKGDYKVVAIPTTSGSGSEVTDFAILTHNKIKHPLVDKRLRPDVAILDSDLLMELPKGLIAETGFDVLTHAVEAFTSKNAGAISDLYAREAFSSAFASLHGGNGLYPIRLGAVPRHGPQPGRSVPCGSREAKCRAASSHHLLQRPCGRKKVRRAGPGGGDGGQRRYHRRPQPSKQSGAAPPGAESPGNPGAGRYRSPGSLAEHRGDCQSHPE